MPSFGSGRADVLYLVTCTAPPARRAPTLVASLQAQGWDVCLVLTPPAVAWVDDESLSWATGHPVRSAFRGSDESEFAPRGDAVLVAPATFISINMCAAGISDTLALALVNDALGTGSVPLALVPWVNPSLAAHPAYEPSLARLRGAGARIVAPSSTEPEAYDQAVRDASTWLWAAVTG
jgi:phosphopantothenoylcysteine decarboxylase